MGFDWEFLQGSPWFRSWLPSGLANFLGFGSVLGYGGIWYFAGIWLIRIGCEEWVLQEFFLGSPCFGPWLPLGLVYFGVFGGVSGSRWILDKAGAWLIRVWVEGWVL